MVPPTEQLIRDYLNRLSVAARGQLEPDDRRALVDRTRDFIERKAGLAGPPTAMEVGKLLFGLGDPSTLVQRERQRLTAIRGELPQPPEIRNPITKVLRRETGRPRASSWRWPAAAGQTDIQLTLLDSGAVAEAGGNGSNGSGPAATAAEGARAASDEARPHVPAQRRDRDWFFRALGNRPTSGAQDQEPTDSDQPGQVRPPWRLVGTGALDPITADVDDGDLDEQAGASPLATVSPTWRPTISRGAMFTRRAGRALSAAATWYGRRPLEASAVLLLGLGGAIYPPIWLLGAVVALPSRVWDGRDKWLGLTLPPLLTILAAVLGVTANGHASVGHAMHEGWVFAVTGSRVAAVLSASYLGWRSMHERRPPAVPPWNRPHRVG